MDTIFQSKRATAEEFFKLVVKKNNLSVNGQIYHRAVLPLDKQ